MVEESLKIKAYTYIKDRIINCEYAPGQFLDERELIQEIGASRTPIREALNRIEQEKLIQILPKKGVMVTPITLKDIVDLYQIRELIEPASISLHWQHIELEKLYYFKKVFEVNDKSMIDTYDDEFHSYLISSYQNDYIDRIMSELRLQTQRIRVVANKISSCLDQSLGEHLEIINKLINEDYMAASESMRKHIVLSKKRTMDAMQKY